MMVLIRFWGSLTKKIVFIVLDMIYKKFYFYSSFRMFFSRICIRIFPDRIHIFGQSGSGLRKKVWSGSETLHKYIVGIAYIYGGLTITVSWFKVLFYIRRWSKPKKITLDSLVGKIEKSDIVSTLYSTYLGLIPSNSNLSFSGK